MKQFRQWYWRPSRRRFRRAAPIFGVEPCDLVGIDQAHAAFSGADFGEKCFVAMADDIDYRIANSDHVVARVCHEKSPGVRRHYKDGQTARKASISGSRPQMK